MNFRKIITVSLAVATIISCKKQKEEKTEIYQSKLPNYSNVDLSKVFTPAESTLENESTILPLINNYYQKVWEQGDLSGGILVAKGDKIIFEKYSGFGRENMQMPIDENTPLHVASVSKTMTAMAVLKLVEAGKLKMEDDLTKFFPKFPYKDITVFSLLSQRSGLPKYEHFDQSIKPAPEELKKDFISNQDVLDMLIKYKPELARVSNTGFMYCNTNFALLALIVEKVTATPFPEAMQEIVFKPLKMNHTYIFQKKDIPTASQSFYSKYRLYPLDKLDLIYGDKNAYTTPRDLLNFSVALFSKDFLKPELATKIFEPYSNEKKGINNYGLGFRMKEFDNGEKLTYHNGWWHGTNSVFAHLLKSKVTIIAIGNKYSQRVYSALSLSGLFENFPFEMEKFNKTMNPKGASGESDSVNVNAGE
ncbi:serine hydrolase domain-containing protein [Epilithonimonas hominis]|uniref:CubicO group peptidase, beta-lactamase class C family n=1 Tax=Epilithonimonas hominis TaxID=420404 RepID=A0A1H6KN94_9FLAO|nr:serine hydrolase domain-containing protein [Epilithonimonas hominis]SEH77194.1 CubicO group peptidase, beta-lactamase class C family [Epilithonimonas hominis]